MKTLKSIIKIIFDSKKSIFSTLYFNFHYFPYKIAIKLPIIIYKNVKIKCAKGKVSFNSNVEHGMVHLGKNVYGFQSHHNITIWEQIGGEIIFDEKVTIGNGSFISNGKEGILNIGNNTLIGCAKVICYQSITIKEKTRISWDVTILDTDFHECVNINTGKRTTAKKDIIIGKNNWIGFGCTILKGTVTPDFCIVAAKSLTNKNYEKEGQYIVLGSNVASVCAKDIYRDIYSKVE